MPSISVVISSRAPQATLLALLAIGFAGCSADMSTRLQQASNGSPFANDQTAAAPPRATAERRESPRYQRPAYSAAPVYQSQQLPPPAIAAAPSYPAVSSAPVQAAPAPMPSYSQPPRPALDETGSVGRKAAAKGTSIIVGTSDTLETLAQRYQVSTAAILSANGYRGPRALSPGQSLIIPPRAPVAAAIAAPVPAPVAPVASAPAAGSSYTVAAGDTLLSVARRHNVGIADLARANGVAPNAMLRVGSRVKIPGSVQAAAPVAPVQTAAAEPVQKIRMATTATPDAAAEAAESPVKAAEANGGLPTFRWPVRGRVLTAYGAKTNGKSNDGINVAVPEGTPVKAAEDGVVAYAGNELKGYGNLVLVRHANGYVTAYAHASELMVKRGETIKRGQTIAKSGQSGDIGSPQLHFEIRKGSTPVDPLQFLNGA